jgi:hypothetical protein
VKPAVKTPLSAAAISCFKRENSVLSRLSHSMIVGFNGFISAILDRERIPMEVLELGQQGLQ